MGEKTASTSWEGVIGDQLRALRIEQGIDQREMAARAGIALNAVKRVENGWGSTLISLIRMLEVLGRTDWLGSLHVATSRRRISKRERAIQKGDADERPLWMAWIFGHLRA